MNYSLELVLKDIKRRDVEKVGISLKIPVSLKKELDTLCKENDITVTGFLRALIEAAVEEDSTSSEDES